MTRLALLLAAALPLAAPAQQPPAPPTAPADATSPLAAAPAAAALPPQGTAAPAPAAPAARPGVTVELGGWLAASGYVTYGGLASNELPRAALPPDAERTLGMSVRQSRLRAALGLPSDGLLAGARLEGLVELDFMGGAVGGDASMPLVRLRHAWVSASWKELENLTVLVGQGWGLVGGGNAPVSLGHLAVPRFSGAGVLYRRAPQVRASVETDGPISVVAQLALLAPMDRATSPASTLADPDRPPPTGVGERSGLPDVEGRLALRWRTSERRRFELGLSGHAGREKWRLTSGGDFDATVDSYAGALDARLDAAWLTVHGGAFYGKNLDVLNTLVGGVTLALDGAGKPLAATGVEAWGAWGQLVVRPWPWLSLLAGAGRESATRADLAASPAALTVPRANLQASGGALVDLTSRWQAGVEYTTYRTTWAGLTDRDVTSGQLQVSSRYCF